MITTNLASLVFVHHYTFVCAQEKEKIPVENTYRLAPAHTEVFNPCRVSNALQVLLGAFLEGKSYTPAKASRMACDLTTRILVRAKK